MFSGKSCHVQLVQKKVGWKDAAPDTVLQVSLGNFRAKIEIFKIYLLFWDVFRILPSLNQFFRERTVEFRFATTFHSDISLSTGSLKFVINW